MTTRKITAANADVKIKRLYETAFPEDEQILWEDLLRLVGEMPLDFTAYYDGEEFIGFTIAYPRKSFNWYWYFAVREELRGKGYGRQILTQWLEHYKVRLVCWIWRVHTKILARIQTSVNIVTIFIFAKVLGTRMYIVPTTTSPGLL